VPQRHKSHNFCVIEIRYSKGWPRSPDSAFFPSAPIVLPAFSFVILFNYAATLERQQIKPTGESQAHQDQDRGFKPQSLSVLSSDRNIPLYQDSSH
jgi:hypothetical protein